MKMQNLLMEAALLRLWETFEAILYREVYTVRFEEVIYVLHIFQKKSKKGIETPKQDIELIKSHNITGSTLCFAGLFF